MIHDNVLLKELEMLKEDIVKHNQDLLISVWGNEGTGKSTFAANLAIYLDHTFTPEAVNLRVAQTLEDYARVMPDVGKLKVGWWDEAHRFSRRGQSDTDANRWILEYLQDIRGANKIQIWCFPELQEIDRKAIQRSRMFFETVKKGDQFWVRGWTKQQVKIMVRQLRLASRKSLQEAWIGVSREPKRVFQCDYKNFPDKEIPPLDKVMEEYNKLKEGSIRRSEERLRQHGYYDPLDICKEVTRRTDMSWDWAQKQAYKITHTALDEEWATEDDIQKIGQLYKIKTKKFFDYLVGTILQNVPEKRNILIPMENTTEVFNTNIQIKHINNNEVIHDKRLIPA